MAHHEPKVLAQLTSSLKAEWAHCFVHIDRRSDIKTFDAEDQSSNVTFLPDNQRTCVYWGGYSMVAATLNLLRYAMESPHQPERFVLLSGVDCPIKSMDDIAQVLWQDREYIQIDRKLDPAGNNEFDRRLNRRFLGDNRWLNPRTCRHLVDVFTRKVERRLVRRYPNGLQMFYGPQWWALTRDAIQEVFRYLEENPAVDRWFGGVKVPDESMFHSILKSSSRSDKIAFDATRLGEPPFGSNRHSLHYVDWTKGNPYLPRTLNLEDLEQLTQSNALFARKLDTAQSSELLQTLALYRERQPERLSAGDFADHG